MNLNVRSMTGFGKAEFEMGHAKFRVEIRSVNHRFIDLKTRLPREFQPLESQIRTLVQSRFNRGSLDLKLERSVMDSPPNGGSENPFEINESRAQEAIVAFQKLALLLGSNEKPSLKDIASFPEVIQSKGGEDRDLSTIWKQKLEPSVLEALQELQKMREVEGLALLRVLLDSTQVLQKLIQEVSNLRKHSEVDTKQKMTHRLQEVFDTFPLPSTLLPGSIQPIIESRIAQEVALLLDRTDIQEEIDRFQGHIEHFDKTLTSGGTIGRKLEFILQELGREINTLGNKAQDLSISQQVVEIKVKLEQLREQVLNLE